MWWWFARVALNCNLQCFVIIYIYQPFCQARLLHKGAKVTLFLGLLPGQPLSLALVVVVVVAVVVDDDDDE